MQKLNFQKTFTVVPVTDEYADLIQKTAKLIKRSFPATLKMVEKWEPSFLASLYDDCLTKWRNRGFTSPAHMFWTERKKLLNKTKAT